MPQRSKAEFVRLGNLFIRHRAILVKSSRKVLQSAIVDDDGYFGELIAAICIGVTGRGVHGVDDEFGGDLSDGTEVKKAYRLDPNVDVILENIVIAEDRNSFTSDMPTRRDLLLSMGNKNSCSIQKIELAQGKNELVSTSLTKTRTKCEFTLVGPDSSKLRTEIGKSPKLKLGAEYRNGDSVVIRQNGHINFGKNPESTRNDSNWESGAGPYSSRCLWARNDRCFRLVMSAAKSSL